MLLIRSLQVAVPADSEMQFISLRLSAGAC